jgi:hypothetical protein
MQDFISSGHGKYVRGASGYIDEVDEARKVVEAVARHLRKRVDPDEGLAFFDEVEDAPNLFLSEQPPGTTGHARRLYPTQFYVACRWDYETTPKDMLADQDIRALVRAKKNGRHFLAHPADWGPHEDTDRAADISPGLMAALGIETDDEIEVIYPAPRK